MTAIVADGLVQAPPSEVFAFLSDLRNHWRLTDRWVRMLDLTGPMIGPTGGWVELRGPLGVRRRLRTTVTDSSPPNRISGVAEVMPHTRARVTWSLEPVGGSLEPVGEMLTRVHLEACILDCGLLDRVLLALGASRWLTRRFAATLGQLAQQLAGAERKQRYEPVASVFADRP